MWTHDHQPIMAQLIMDWTILEHLPTMHIIALPNMGRLTCQISKGAVCHSQSGQTSQSQLMSLVPSHMPSHSFFVSPSAHLFISLSYPSIRVHPSLSCPSELIHLSRSIRADPSIRARRR